MNVTWLNYRTDEVYVTNVSHARRPAAVPDLYVLYVADDQGVKRHLTFDLRTREVFEDGGRDYISTCPAKLSGLVGRITSEHPVTPWT